MCPGTIGAVFRASPMRRLRSLRLHREDRPDIIPVGCLAHGRRKFVEALKDEPKQAEWFVGEIRKLYLIEKHARDHQMRPAERHELRHKLAPSIWEGMTLRLRELLEDPHRYLPESPIAKALKYARSEWM